MIRLRVLERILLYGIWAGFFLILLTPLVVTPQTVFPYVVGKALYSRSVIEIVFALWILLALFGPSYRPPRSWLLLLLAVSLGVSVLAAYSGVSPERSLWSTYERMQGVVDMAHWFVLAVVLASTVRSIRSWCILLNLNLSVSLMIALLVIGQYHSVNMPAFSDLLVSLDGLRPGVDLHGRAFATFGSANYLGVYMTVNSTVALGFLIRSFIPVSPPHPSPPPRGMRRRRHGRISPRKKTSPPTGKSDLFGPWLGRLFWGGTALLDLWVIRLSGTRGALLGLVVSIGFVVVLYLWLRRSRIARLVSLGSMGLLAGAVMLSATLFFRPDALPFDASFLSTLAGRQGPAAIESARRSVQARTAVLKTAFQGFADRPILGWGPENFIVVFGRYVPHESELDHGKMAVHDYAHSKLAEELVTKGLIGLLIYLSIWALTFRVVVRTARRMDSRGRALVLFAGAALMGTFVQSQFLFDTAAGSLQYVLLLALVVHLEAMRREATPVQGQGTHLRRIGVRAVMATGAMILVGAGLLANHATYSAASDIIRAARQTNTPEQIRDYLREAIAGFTPLASVPRLMLFRATRLHWPALRSRSPAEVQRAFALIDAEAAAAIESEPENWRIHEELVRFYRRVARGHPEYQAAARHHLERLSELAPNRAPTR